MKFTLSLWLLLSYSLSQDIFVQEEEKNLYRSAVEYSFDEVLDNGAYTFILEGTKDIPNRLLNGKRKTIGIRVSSHPVVQSILANLMEPMMSVSLKIEGYEFYNSNDVKEVINGSSALIIDSGHCPPEPTTIIDLSNDEVLVLRNGNGSLELVT
jgi:tRNA threonylcarbamoyl adenosine modification protein (Sua5/YciO/YrdC/YwlC family)